MADEFQDKLNSLLSNPDMMKAISSLAGSMNEGNDGVSSNLAPSVDLSENLKSVMSGLNTNSDSRINLLNAIKPYMRSQRAGQVDNAIKILKLTKLTSLLKDISEASDV